MGNKSNSFYIKRTHTRSYEKRLNLSFEVVVVFVKKKKGLICHRANNVACHLFGMKKNEITGKTLKFLSCAQQPFTDKSIEAIISEKSETLINSEEGTDSFYWAFQKKNGKFYSLVHLRLIILGSKKGFQILLTETSEKLKKNPNKSTEFQKDGVLVEGELYSDYSTYIPKKKEQTKFIPRKKSESSSNKKHRKSPNKKTGNLKGKNTKLKSTQTRKGRTQQRTSSTNSQKYTRSLSCSPRTAKNVRLKNNRHKKKKPVKSSSSEDESFNLKDPLSQLDTTINGIKIEVTNYKNETLEDRINDKLDSLSKFVKETIFSKEKDTENLRNSISQERKEFKKKVQTLENSLNRRLMELEKEKEQKVTAFDDNMKIKKQLTEITKLFQKQIGLNKEITNYLQEENFH
ncbi:hypothetical protein M0813_18470 [Anaeramoeba flamelloides]|uniref:PAS domain-containing protein n=1 Tax=Anaeramoeba flamelloides TaxID=1746091 RepID=A0ABQ8YT71_9EUKA|nr:hypothetical protein M0813_18470 [Anaeramoeba flamelloides]